MAKKSKKETKSVENAELEALVNEGKNIDTVKVAEVLADNQKEEEVEIEDLIQKAKEAQAEEIIAGILEETVEEEETLEDNEDTIEIVEEDKEDCGIDDVIAECTGEAELKPKKVDEDDVPWYVARAMRACDYYNW